MDEACEELPPEDVVFVRRSVCIEGSRGNDTSVFIDDTFVLDGSKLSVFGRRRDCADDGGSFTSPNSLEVRRRPEISINWY